MTKRIKLTDENKHFVISSIVKKSKDCNEAISKLCKLKYPKKLEDSEDHYIKKEEAKVFYSKYSKINQIMKMDKEFTEKAYNINSKIYKQLYF